MNSKCCLISNNINKKIIELIIYYISSSSKSSSVTSQDIEKTITSPEILEKSLPDLKKPCEPINHKAESEVDKITEALMTNLENGTTPERENTVPERGPNEICAKCKQPIASFDAACSVSSFIFSSKTKIIKSSFRQWENIFISRA